MSPEQSFSRLVGRAAVLITLALALPVLAILRPVAAQSTDELHLAARLAQSPGANHALLIANSAYSPLPPVQSAPADSATLKAALEKVGFKVAVVRDGDLVAMRRAVGDLAQQLKSGKGVGLLYFLGHAQQSNGQNVLLPVRADAKPSPEADGLRLSEVVASLTRSPATPTLIVLDAGYSSTPASGLAPLAVEPASGITVALSAAPGQLLGYRDAKSGIYARVFAHWVQSHGYTLSQIIGATRSEVIFETDGRQRPWDPTQPVEVATNPSTTPPAQPTQPTQPAQPTQPSQPTQPAVPTTPPTAPLQGPPPVFPDSSQRFISEADVKDLDCQRLFIARNEIYARNGYCFRSPEAKALFKGICRSEQTDILSDLEFKNTRMIHTFEVKKGCRVPQEATVPPILQGRQRWLFPDSSRRALADKDIGQLDCRQLYIARNEIYARNGLCFKTKAATEIFGNEGCSTQSLDILNRVEDQNVKFIRSHEQRKSCKIE